MKKLNKTAFAVFALSLLIIFAAAQVAQINDAKAESVTYNIDAGSYEIIPNEQGFDEIIMPDYGIIESPGDPILPQKTLEFWVPQGVIWSSLNFSVEIIESEVLPNSYNIPPCLPISPVQDGDETRYDPEYYEWGAEKSIVDGKNTLVYEEDANYPSNALEFIGYTQRKEPQTVIESPLAQQTQQSLVENNYVRVLFRPFLYNPVQQKLTFIKQAEINIAYEYPTIMSVEAQAATTYDYVIITTNDISSHSEELTHFINLKQLYGHNVKVVTENDFGSLTGQAPNGRAEKIRQWLINNYQSLGIDYVLLIGNPDPDNPDDLTDSVGDIPMKMCWPRYFSPSYRESPTDYFFADLTGNWNLDGDQHFGEGLEVNHIVSPDPAIGADTFSARWTGTVMFDFTDTYNLQTFSDNGVRLYIDGSLVIDNWVEHSPASNSVSQAMTAGKHDITIEFWENTGDSLLQLYWSCSSEGQPHYVRYGIIPENHLYDDSDNVGGLTGTYYDNADFTGTSITRRDKTINFIWGTGDTGAGGPDSGAEVFVGRIPVYNNDFAQLDNVLKKIIAYETDPGNIDWRKTMLLPMKPLWSDTPSYHLGEGIENDYALAAGFACYRIYDSDYSPPTPEEWPCTVDNVKNEWKNGYGIITWATHGSPSGASDVFNTGYTNELNDAKPSFTFQASCLTGYPESNNNLGYALLKEGAIATVSATRVSWEQHGAWTFDPTSGYNHNLAYYYAKRVIVNSQSAGTALYLTKGGVNTVGMNEMDYNLYGDPENYLLTVIPNNAPTAEAGGPYEQDEGNPVTFDASSSTDPDANPLQYRWDFENDGTWDTAWSTDPTATHTWADDHVGTAKVAVSDGLVTDTATASVQINNVQPQVNAGSDQTVDEADMVSFSGSFTDPSTSDTHTIEWDFGDGSTSTGTLTPTHAYGDNGVYTVTLTVTDDDGGEGTDTLTVTVLNVAPSISALVMNPPNPANPEFILPIVQEPLFTASASDVGSDDLTFTWNWGDGSATTATIFYNDGVAPDLYPSPGGTYPFSSTDQKGHVYSAPGTYTVTLSVTDDDGGTDTATYEIKILNAEEAKHVINDYIQGLPDDAFEKNPVQRKNALNNMFSAIDKMLANGAYKGAINDLQHNIREKADGAMGGSPKNDWITDATAQVDICWKIDALTAYLQTLI